MITMFHLLIAINFLFANYAYGNEKCDFQNTCRYSKEANLPVCYCDEQCLNFNDCCQEYIVSNKRTVNKSDAIVYSCVDVMTGSQTHSVRVGSVMINRCKNSGSVCDVIPKRLESIVPVSNEENTFRNSHCAHCNGVVNFTYWTIIFKIRKSTEMKSLTSETLFTDEKLIQLKDDILTKEQYYMYPPDGFNTRYCSSEMKKGTNIQHDGLYQNFALCGVSLFKNPDQCQDHESEEIKCLSYDSTYLNRNLTFDRNTAMVPTSSQILLQLGPKTDEAKSLTKVDIEEAVFSFIHKRFNIYLEFNLEESVKINDGKQLIAEFITTLLVLLQSSKYRLFIDFSRFRAETSDGFKYTSSTVVRSMTTLRLSEMTDLLNLSLAIQYLESNGKLFAVGNLQSVSLNFTYPNPSAKTYYGHIDLTKISLLSHFDAASCHNVSFILQERNLAAAVYDVWCMNNPIEKTNGNNHGNMSSVSMNLVVLSVIYALWIPLNTKHF